MGKRSNFERIDRDKYRTPYEAILPLLPQLPAETLFAEPCAGDGILIDHLTKHGHKCVWASDMHPERKDVVPADALTLGIFQDFPDADMFITNTPWTRSIMHPIIDHLSAMLPCWFLFDAAWPFTKQSSDLIRRCSKIVPVGRLKWIADSPYVGMDDCAWYEFRPGHFLGPRLVPRKESPQRNQLEKSTPCKEVEKKSLILAREIPQLNRDGVDMRVLQSTSDLLAKLRSGLRLRTLPKITPATLGDDNN